MYRIGVDLGGTNLVAGIVGDDYRILAKKSIPTRTGGSASDIADDIARLCREVCAENGIAWQQVASVGIASPGAVNHETGVVEYSGNLPFRKYPMAKEVRDRLGDVAVYVSNDANAAAWGEAIAGAAKGTSHSVMVTLGTGVGGGVIIDGRLDAGYNGAGGELGHTVIAFGGRPCTCGRRGCFEAYSSATALVKMTQEKMEEYKKTGRDTLLFKLYAECKDRVGAKETFDAYDAGDAAACEVVETYLDYLACGLTNMINTFQPEVLSIGGGVSNRGGKLIDELLPRIRSERFCGKVEGFPHTDVRIAKLKNDAGIIGAAALGVRK